MKIIKYTEWLKDRTFEQDDELTIIDFSGAKMLLSKDMYEFFGKMNLHLPIKIINTSKKSYHVETIKLVISNLINREQRQKGKKYYD